METQKLLSFKLVADLGSISKAAKQLYIAQPSLSQTIKRMEEEVGMPLFRRTPKGLLLTYAGERYYWMVTQVLRLYENFRAEISSLDELQSGTLSAGFAIPISEDVLPPVLPLFRKTYPNITVNIQIDNSRRLREMLLYGKIDFAVVHGGSAEEVDGLRFQPILETPFVIVASPDDPIREKAVHKAGYRFPVLDPKYLKESRFLTVDQGHQGQRSKMILENTLRKAGIPEPRVEMALRNPTLICEMVGAGFGVTILPYDTIRKFQIRDKIVCYSIPHSYEAVWNICIMTTPNVPLSKIDEKFIEMTTDSIRAEYAEFSTRAHP